MNLGVAAPESGKTKKEKEINRCVFRLRCHGDAFGGGLESKDGCALDGCCGGPASRPANKLGGKRKKSKWDGGFLFVLFF